LPGSGSTAGSPAVWIAAWVLGIPRLGARIGAWLLGIAAWVPGSPRAVVGWN
jgi:hypothetical protein